MKRILLLIFMLNVTICSADFSADFVYDIYSPMGWSLTKPEWTPVNVAIFPVNAVHFNTKNYGLRLLLSLYYGNEVSCGVTCGLSQISGEHYGVAATALYSACGVHYGLSVSPVNLAMENHGAQIGLVNHILPFGETVNYLQVGLYNYAENGLQIGLLNHNPNALIPWMPLFNYSSPNVYRIKKDSN